jgi:hypothetical protein
MPNITGSFSGRVISQTTVSLHDASDHDMNLMQVAGLQKSSDPDWNNARITYWGAADLFAGSGPQRGYFVNEHADGDRDVGTFEGKITTVGGLVTLEGNWKYTGGTGKFSGITGSGTYNGRATSPGEFENSWEGTYQLAAKIRAA